MKKILLIFFAFLCVTTTSAYTERNLLQKQADINQLKETLILNQEWVTYPDYTDRSGWDTFWESLKTNTFVKEKNYWIINGR